MNVGGAEYGSHNEAGTSQVSGRGAGLAFTRNTSEGTCDGKGERMGTGPTCAFRSHAETEYRHRRQTQWIEDGRPCRANPPRQWLYATKPAFARVEKPLAEALEEVEEVRLMMDLRPFWPADVRIEVKLDAYMITATRGELQFVEEIPLPDSVDMLMKEARFRNGVLELILPRKAVPSHTRRLEKGN